MENDKICEDIYSNKKCFLFLNIIFLISGLDIVCEKAGERQIVSALDVLKKDSYNIFWMKIRNCVLARIPDYVFLGLEVIHLSIIRSNVSNIDRSSLSALGGKLDTLDLANNEIKEVI